MKKSFTELGRILSCVTLAYIEAAYFTDTGDIEQPPKTAELSTTGYLMAYEACADFIRQCSDAGLIERYEQTGRTWDSFGHDLWLTRNGHGAGFWDRGMAKLGDELTQIAHCLGSSDLYQGDDDLLYFS